MWTVLEAAVKFVVSQAAPEHVPEREGASHQVVLDGIARRRGSGGHAQLAVDRAHVEVDGDHADDEPLGHLRAGQALGQQAQHLDLAGRQTSGRGCCWLC
ncbi:MAG TPA: hypothetical protein VKR83_10810 [Ktedonobacteraceae bacterium]|nr:hypothetical protein [Ktedonobacteraceae bacterium]